MISIAASSESDRHRDKQNRKKLRAGIRETIILLPHVPRRRGRRIHSGSIGSFPPRRNIPHSCIIEARGFWPNSCIDTPCKLITRFIVSNIT